MGETITAGIMPVLALRGLAVFPDQTIHFEVGRKKSILALEKAMEKDQMLMLIPQKDIEADDPTIKQLNPIGTVARIKQILRPQGDVIRVLVSGICRARIREMTKSDPYLEAMVVSVPDTDAADSLQAHAMRRTANVLYGKYIDLVEYPAQAVQLRMMSSDSSGFIADSIAQNSGFDFKDRMKLLNQLNPYRRLESAVLLLRQEIEIAQLEQHIQDITKANMDRAQRDYYLREQLKAIHEELGDDDEAEFREIEKRLRELRLETDSEKKLMRELDRLRRQPFGSQEGAVLRNYLDTVLELPWNHVTKERIDVAAARKILDKDHFGLQKVKERILETIAVRQMAPNMPPQILCLVGPPGVGKTSIAYSIARALNRKLVRISLGGVHDEAEIRGHRKTYVGAMPGRIMAAMTQAGSRNPILLLDEIDKMGSDHRGDPAAALLEVLDAEQNATYRDHYLEIPFDLSDVMFITTANTLDTVPRPLLDRMEVISLGSYTDEEKVKIAKDHLIPKQLSKHGLKKSQLRISEDTLRQIIHGYTRESGVRNLERVIAEICRKADMHLLDPDVKKITVNSGNLEEFLGVRKYLPNPVTSADPVGLVTGLAWTSVGGEVLEVEVNVMDGTGKLELTGNLGDVMKESVHAAVSYIRANAQAFEIPADFYKTKDIHVHFPEGAVPKDGPSAGITVCTAIISALTGWTVRRDVAMTGEISIRGRVLPIGGLKEKTMAALRHGIHTVIIPSANQKDLADIDPIVRSSLHFVLAESVETVLHTALNRPGTTPQVLLPEIPLPQNKMKPAIHQ